VSERSGRASAYAVSQIVDLGADAPSAILYRWNRSAPAVPPLIERTDIAEALRLYGALGATAVLPERAWPGYARAASGLRLGLHRRRRRETFRRALEAIAGPQAPAEIDRLLRLKREHEHRRKLTVAREVTGRGAPISVAFEGAERLRATLARGRGAILWAAETYPRWIVSKRALWEQGFRPVQVSRVEHGVGGSRFARSAMNPLVLRAEDRYLAGRIVFTAGQEAEVLRRILRALDEGALILMTNNQYSGAVFLEVAFGQAGYLSLPTAALGLAARHGVPLFSLAVLETEPLSAYELRLSEDVREAASPGGNGREAQIEAMARLALPVRDHVLDVLRAAPEQFKHLGVKDFHLSRFPEARAAQAAG
jgi:hypothetical protein